MIARGTVGCAGHVDHGKTTLVRVLTGVETDRRPEERERGISIEAGIAPLVLPSGRRAALIDVPGHVDFLKNTIRGLQQIDAALLVVAADDGVMPQTREHLEILRYFGTATGCAVLSKIDRVDPETADLAEIELRDLLAGTFLAGAPLLRFSSRHPESAAPILQALDALLAHLPPRHGQAPFRMWIDQVRRFPGRGTVASGTLASGSLAVGDEVELLPSGIRARVRSLQTHGEPVDRAAAGQRVGVNLPSVPLSSIVRGMALAAPGSLSGCLRLQAEIEVSPLFSLGLRSGMRVKLYLGTSVSPARLVLLENDRLPPAAAGLAELRLKQPVAARPGDPRVITPAEKNRIAGGGTVLRAGRERFRAARAAGMLPLLAALRRRDAAGYVESRLQDAPLRPLRAEALAGETGMPPAEFVAILTRGGEQGELIEIAGEGVVAEAAFSRLKQDLQQAAERILRENPMKKTLLPAELASATGDPNPAVLRAALEDLERQGTFLAAHGGLLPAAMPQDLPPAESELAGAILDFAGRCGITPFSADRFWKAYAPRFKKEATRRMLHFLHARGRLVRPDDMRFLSPAALEEIKRRVQAAARQGHVSAACLGVPFDLHGGGEDLRFPHHENELALLRCLSGSPAPVGAFLHHGLLCVRGRKLSKSAGPRLRLEDLEDQIPAGALRLFLLSSHYRRPLEADARRIEQAVRAHRRLLARLARIGAWGAHPPALFPPPPGLLVEACLRALEEDLNAPRAIALLYAAVRHGGGRSAPRAAEIAYVAGDLLGIADRTEFESLRARKANREPAVPAAVEAPAECGCHP